MVHTGVSERGFTHHIARFALEHSLGELPSPVGDASINMMINAAAAALAEHKSQVQGRDTLEILSQWRARIGEPKGIDYAAAFRSFLFRV